MAEQFEGVPSDFRWLVATLAATCLVIGVATAFLYNRWEAEQARTAEEITSRVREHNALMDRRCKIERDVPYYYDPGRDQCCYLGGRDPPCYPLKAR
jgi:hypothetical protein